jgi:hypothetical protein
MIYVLLRKRDGDEDNEEKQYIIMSWQEKATITKPGSKLYHQQAAWDVSNTSKHNFLEISRLALHSIK